MSVSVIKTKEEAKNEIKNETKSLTVFLARKGITYTKDMPNDVRDILTQVYPDEMYLVVSQGQIVMNSTGKFIASWRHAEGRTVLSYNDIIDNAFDASNKTEPWGKLLKAIPKIYIDTYRVDR